jgi:hypothetical protein
MDHTRSESEIETFAAEGRRRDFAPLSFREVLNFDHNTVANTRKGGKASQFVGRRHHV